MAEAKQPKAEAKVNNDLPKDVIVVNADILKPKKYTFQIAGGSDIVSVVERDANGAPMLVPVLDGRNEPKIEDGKKVMRIATREVHFGPRRPAGDIIESDKRLDEIHNLKKPFPPRYILLDKNRDPHAEALSEEKRRSNRLAEDRRKLLRRMTVTDLRLYAEEEGIDVGGAKTPDEMIQRIESRQRDFIPTEPALVAVS